MSPALNHWPAPTPENRPGVFWWWMGSAVDPENITQNLEALHEAGIGGVTIVPIYGAKGYEDRYIPYLSPKWLEMLDHSIREAGRLGMWVDMSTTTGWPFGGPDVSEQDQDAVAVLENGRVGQVFSGRNVKRAALGGEGPAINPYSPAAMTHYLERFDAAFADPDLARPRAQYHDSFEYAGNWTQNLPQQFHERRGYDLLQHLPALSGEGDPEIVARVKADYRQTLAELHFEYMQTWTDWAASHGFETRNQAHGAPGNLLDLYALATIPETETFGASKFAIPGLRREPGNVGKDQPQPLINSMAASAAHVVGRRLVSSESTTWLRNHFRTALSQIRPEIDQLFLSGVNHIVFHGSIYSPRDAPWPGWLFYASTQYNPRNSIWRDAPLLNAYITRVQSFLQSGQHGNEICVYWPIHDIWHNYQGMQQMLTVHEVDWMLNSTAGRLGQWLKQNGYGFDFISDRQILNGLAGPYKLLLVPETVHMPLETMQALMKLRDSGQHVLFIDDLPRDVPGLHNFEQRRESLAQLQKGRGELVVKQDSLQDRLESMGALRESMTSLGLSFIRRKDDDGWFYFIANHSVGPVDQWVTLAAPLKGALILDPDSAQVGRAPQQGSKIYLQLEPGETRIIRTFLHRDVSAPEWPILRPMGEPTELQGEWRVEFISGGPELPEPFTSSTLGSWTDAPDPEAKRFAGTARYTLEFHLPDNPSAADYRLSLGDVRESARIIINCQSAANLWSIPFEANVGRFLKPGKNTIQIEVTNLSANRIRDLDQRGVEWRTFHDINFVDIHYHAFDASKWSLTPSGLLGPVTITALEKREGL